MIDFNRVYDVTKNLTILYVEDNKDFREETSDVLSMLFKKVDLAIDGKEAIEKYKLYYDTTTFYYDIVITDIEMPIINGLELSKLIYKQNNQQPIIVITAYKDVDYLFDFINLGVKQFLLKPIDSNQILNIFYKIANEIKELLNKNNMNNEVGIIRLKNNYLWNEIDNILSENNIPIKLTNKEILLMQVFVKNRNIIAAYDEIFYKLWQDNEDKATFGQLKTIISNFRKKLPYQKIENISKVGYRLLI
jgi:DNA-binding response OmpR family regulator